MNQCDSIINDAEVNPINDTPIANDVPPGSIVITSFDIGMKNLSFCVFRTNPDAPPNTTFPYHILEWQNVDISANKKICSHSKTFKNGNSQTCANAALFKHDNTTISADGTKSTISNYFCSTHAKKQPGAKRMPPESLFDTCISLIQTLQKYESTFILSDHVIMEEQPNKNPMMKKLSMMIFSFFTQNSKSFRDDSRITNVQLISPKHKLQVYTGPPVQCDHLKQQYDKNKFLSVEYCKWFLDGTEYLPLMMDHKKKSDLADCLLQGLWFVKNIVFGNFDKNATKLKNIKSKKVAKKGSFTLAHLKFFMEQFIKQRSAAGNKTNATSSEIIEYIATLPPGIKQLIEKNFKSVENFAGVFYTIFPTN